MHSRSDIKLTPILYFLFPIFALIKSIKDYRLKSAKNLFWFFCAFYGLVHIYMPDGFLVDVYSTVDSVRYALALDRMHSSHLTWSTLKDTFYSGGNSTDLYQPIVTFLVSRFTGNAHFLFCVFAIVFGYFYSRNIWYIISKSPSKLGFQLGVLIIAFALLTPIWMINGVRMWTALQVFMYGLIPYLISNDKSKLWWSFASFLFHFSFLFLIALLLIYLYIPRYRLPFFVLFIISLFVGELDLAIVRERLLALNLDAFDSKINTYTADYVVEKMHKSVERVSWHVTLAQNLNKYIYQGFIIISFFAIPKCDSYKRKLFDKVFCAATLFFSFANIVSTIPSGGRFAIPAQMLSVITAILIFPHLRKRGLRNLYTLGAFGLIYPIIFSIRSGMDYWGISLIFLNPLTCWLFVDNIPVIEYIKSIL